jgi:hypothetical protein
MKKILLPSLLLLLTHSLFAQTPAKAPKAIRLIDKQFNLSGTLSGATAQSFVGLEAGDNIVVNCTRQSKKGSVSISVKEFNKGTELYRKDGFDTLRDQTIPVTAKGIYVVALKTGSLLDRDVLLTVDRIPHATAAVKPASKTLYDTSSVEVTSTTMKVFPKNSQSNKSVLKLNLPPNTTYWTFWIGAGKDAVEKMKAFTVSASTVGALYPADPMVLFGMKYISSLPMVPPNALISYHFMDSPNSTAFKNNQQFSFYTFKSAEKITTEYSFMMNHQPDLNLGITNESSNTPYDVEVRVVAFIVKAKEK